jgi:hypothetical protein
MLTADGNGSKAHRLTGPIAGRLGLGILSGLALASALGCAAILFWFDPSQSRFYPRCLFQEATGLLCPGCGSLRAIHQLLHGNLAAALRFNALLVVSLPVLAWFGGRYWVRRLRQQPPGTFQTKWLFLFLGIAVAFSIWRNLPGGLFALHL